MASDPLPPVPPRKPSIKPAGWVLSRDRRPPVLYLHSFELDELTSQEGTGGFRRTPEELLFQILGRVGPCIAVGILQSTKIDHGFSRFVFGNDWPERVEELIKLSGLVVHCAGGSEGLLWELKRVAELVEPRSKLVLVVTTTATEKWWELADTLFGHMPRFTIPMYDDFPYIAVIYFDEAGKPQCELICGFNKPARVIVEEAFDPLFHRMNISPRPKFDRWLSSLYYRLTNSRLFYLIIFSLLLLLLNQCPTPPSDIQKSIPIM